MTSNNSCQPPPSRRRRFRFSLRTFFVVVAVLSAWLAWQVSIVREREAFLQRVKAAGLAYEVRTDVQALRSRGREPEIPFVRQLLGDLAVRWIATDGKEIDREARRLFPEANVEAYVLFDDYEPAITPNTTSDSATRD